MGSDYRLIQDDIPSSKRQLSSSRRRTLSKRVPNRMFHRALFVPDKADNLPAQKYVWDVGFAYLAVAD